MTVLRDKSKRSALRSELFGKLQTVGVPLSETVKALRKILGKDQESFSTEVGVSLSTLRKLEQEGGGVTLATIDKILARFDLELVVRAKTPGSNR